MAENISTTILSNNDEDNVVRKESQTNNSISKASDENTKRQKGSFLSQLRKRLSFRKKAKPKDASIINGNNLSVKQSDVSSQNDPKQTKKCLPESGKPETRFSAIRRSFGKGKNKENLSNKDTENCDSARNRNSVCNSLIRPQSMHIANSYPPRNCVLASFGWYWGPLSRSEATHRLRHQNDGSFLVRDSEGDPNKFTLSFKGSGQIFHNRILTHQNKYAFLPDEEFDSIPDLITDAMRRSATSAYCFSRSTDVAPAHPVPGAGDGHTVSETLVTNVTGNGVPPATGTVNHKHEVRLLQPVSRFTGSPRSLKYLARFMIRQYTRLQDLSQLVLNPEMLLFLADSKYNI